MGWGGGMTAMCLRRESGTPTLHRKSEAPNQGPLSSSLAYWAGRSFTLNRVFRVRIERISLNGAANRPNQASFEE